MGPQTDGPPPLKKMILPALFVGGLFYVSFFRTPPPPPLIVVSGRALGTSWTLKVAASDVGGRGAELSELVGEVLAEVDGAMSTYKSDSELMVLNGADGLTPVALSKDLGVVLAEALDISAASDGAFDVTVGPLVSAWGFGPQKTQIAPTAAVLAALEPMVGTDKLELTPAGITKAHPGVFIDLSAIAKGYAVDLVVARLQGAGVENLLMELGGEIVARGHGPTGQLWRLGIETPSSTERQVFHAVDLDDAAMATSGDYRQYYEHEGRRVSHLIDPRVGRPIDHKLASVTVVAQRCSTADGWATALSVLGEKEGLAVAESLGLKAFFIIRDDDGGFFTAATAQFSALGQAHD